MEKLFIMCGIPGSGKSTYLKNIPRFGTVVISRDDIRLSLLKKDDDYFLYEPIVQTMFYEGIKKSLQLKLNVYADQTSITPTARKLLMYQIHTPCEFNAIWLDTPLEECLKRNGRRCGRKLVPENAIINMSKNFIPPSYKEGFANIYRIYNNGNCCEKILKTGKT